MVIKRHILYWSPRIWQRKDRGLYYLSGDIRIKILHLSLVHTELSVCVENVSANANLAASGPTEASVQFIVVLLKQCSTAPHGIHLRTLQRKVNSDAKAKAWYEWFLRLNTAHASGVWVINSKSITKFAQIFPTSCHSCTASNLALLSFDAGNNYGNFWGYFDCLTVNLYSFCFDKSCAISTSERSTASRKLCYQVAEISEMMRWRIKKYGLQAWFLLP